MYPGLIQMVTPSKFQHPYPFALLSKHNAHQLVHSIPYASTSTPWWFLTRIGYLLFCKTTNPISLDRLMVVLYKKWRPVVPVLALPSSFSVDLQWDFSRPVSQTAVSVICALHILGHWRQSKLHKLAVLFLTVIHCQLICR